MRKCFNLAIRVVGAICAAIIVCQSTRCASQQQLPSGSAIDDALNRFLQKYLGPPTDETRTTRYSAAFFDLRGDGKREAVVYLTGPAWCGTGGCTMLILVPAGDSYKAIKRMPTVVLPISVLVSKSNGWHDLCLVTGRPLDESVLSFNGRSYLHERARRSSDQTEGEALVTESTHSLALYQANKGQ